MMREGFGGESYSGDGYDNTDLGAEGYSQQKRAMRKLGASADNLHDQVGANHEIYQSNNAGGTGFNDEEDENNRVQRGPVTLKNGATYVGQWLNNQRDGYG